MVTRPTTERSTFFADHASSIAAESVPEGMVRVPAGSASSKVTTLDVPAFWMDRLRGHQPPVQGVRRRRRLLRSREYWTAAVRRRTAGRSRGRRRWPRFRDHDRTSWARPPGSWARIRRVRRTFRLAASAGTKRRPTRSLPASRCRPCSSGACAADFAGPSGVRRHPAAQQLQRKGPAAVGTLKRHRPVRAVRHGRQRQGMVLERIGDRPNDPRWRLERAEIHV